MTKEMILGIARQVLTVAGAFLLGKNLFGAAIDESILQEVSGALLMIVSLVWTIKSKELTLEILQSVLLKVIIVAGTLLVSSGKLTGTTLNAIVGIVTALLPIIYSLISKKKSDDVKTGQIQAAKLS
jgi:hypothetical protein